MPLSPPQRRRPALTNSDQTVTKVDKTNHRQPPPKRKPRKTQHNRNRTHHLNTQSVNPRVNPSRSPPNTPKKPTLNTAAAHPQRQGGRDELGQQAGVALAVGGKCEHALTARRAHAAHMPPTFTPHSAYSPQ